MSESPFAPMRVVLTGLFHSRALDDAIDLDATELIVYRLKRRWDLLTFRDSRQPSVFVVKKLSRAFLRNVIAREDNAERKRLLAFAVACHEIQTPAGGGATGDGSVLRPQSEWLTDGVHGTKVASDDWLDFVADKYSEEALHEIGLVALDFARLAKGAEGPFSLRPT